MAESNFSFGLKALKNKLFWRLKNKEERNVIGKSKKNRSFADAKN